MKKEFFVTLLSNSNSIDFPSNNVFEFTNILSRELTFPPEEKWKVCLTSISLTNVIHQSKKEIDNLSKTKKWLKDQVSSLNKNKNLSEEKKTLAWANINDVIKKYRKTSLNIYSRKNPIFVKCDTILPSYGYHKFLTSFIAPVYNKETTSFITYEPETLEYHNIGAFTLKHISVRIENSEGDVLKSSISQPSIVVLKFKQVMEEIHSVYINSTGDNPADFRVSLPHNLVADGEQNPWEIALQRITFLPDFDLFPSSKQLIRVVSIMKPEVYSELNNIIKGRLEPNKILHLGQKVSAEQEFEYKEEYTDDTDFAEWAFTIIQAVCKRIDVTAKLSLDEDKKITLVTNQKVILYLPSELIYCLGLDSPGLTFNNGFGIISTKDTITTGNRSIDLNFLTPKNILIYSDCVLPSSLGNISGKYLTNIPITKQNDSEFFFYEPRNLEFHPIIPGDLNNVHFKLMRTDGELIRFKKRESLKIFMTLQFRKK